MLDSSRNLGGKRLDVASLDERLELLYTSLYLLIWGEAANLRFMPECLTFIFHNVPPHSYPVVQSGCR